jgi:hypothetical protein
MAQSILQQVLQSINSGKSLDQAVESIIPGADLTLWQRRVAQAANPPKKSKKANSRPSTRSGRGRSSGRPSKHTHYADQVLRRGYAMAELTERAKSRAIFITSNGDTKVLEVRA